MLRMPFGKVVLLFFILVGQVMAEQLWSVQPLKRPEVPRAGDGWALNPVDRFIAQKLAGAGIMPGKKAMPSVLLRRVYFDVTGLPPAPKEVAAFSKAQDLGYGQLVDRLMASPHFGERWASHWLDIARFAESHGFEMDQPRPDAWRYRDFVIRAFNEDMPYDEFVRLQLAGDLLKRTNPDAWVATGFLVAGVENLIQTRKEFERDRYDKVDDMVSTVGTALLGLTIGCSRCHDHKYDPLSQRDYYHLAAAFGSTVSRVKELERGETRFKSFVATEVADGKIPMVVVTEPSFKKLPTVSARIHFLDRGDVTKKREAVSVRYPKVLIQNGAEPSRWSYGSAGKQEVSGRVALAGWITDHQDGAGHLLARVIVNRVWHHYFGRGIVGTPSDFGTRGEPPTHPELLDWLAGELIQNGWRLKPIHRLILTSATYRQGFQSAATNGRVAGYEELDPDNLLLWRRNPKRLDASAIRDNLLAVSGWLDSTPYGPGSLDQNHPRRSVYLTVKRSRLIPFLQSFDAPNALQGIGQRQDTITSLQGLTMLNSPFVDRAVQRLAKRLAGLGLKGDTLYVREGFLMALGRLPSGVEERTALEFVSSGQAHARRDFCQMLVCLNEFIHVE